MTRNQLTDWAEHSRFVQRIRRRYATEQGYLPSGIPNRSDMETLFTRLREQYDAGSDGRAAITL